MEAPVAVSVFCTPEVVLVLKTAPAFLWWH